MTNQNRFLAWLARTTMAQSAKLYTVSGTACPCMSSGNRNSYSQNWHRLNPTAEDCNGTGKIADTTTYVNIKAVIYSAQQMPRSIHGVEKILSMIGEVNVDDMILIGTINSDTFAYVDLSATTEYANYILFNSLKYHIRNVFNIMDVGQAARLVRAKS
jgi:hypothetical protein